MASGVKNFLSSIGMGRHFQMFQTRGYDDEADIPHLTSSDLACVGVSDPVEIIIILKAAKSYSQSPEYSLLCWLRENGLEHYLEGFVQSSLTQLSDVSHLNLPSEELYDELEITLPGHQRRLERAVCALRKRGRQGSSDTEEERDLVTEGWWGFPTYLPNAKYPFLCVQASIKSTRPLATPKNIDFMVDSGSDVSTMREEIIQDLNLEPITTVKSCGVYGSQRTTMYRAFLTIGDCKLDIEVIGSSYDSLGSRVLRHFHHRIDNNRHKWFRITSSSPDNDRVSHNSSGEEVAETVSIFPLQADRACAASDSQRNSTTSKTQSSASFSNKQKNSSASNSQSSTSTSVTNSQKNSTPSKSQRSSSTASYKSSRGVGGGDSGALERDISRRGQETEDLPTQTDEPDSGQGHWYSPQQTDVVQKRSRDGGIKGSNSSLSPHPGMHFCKSSLSSQTVPASSSSQKFPASTLSRTVHTSSSSQTVRATSSSQTVHASSSQECTSAGVVRLLTGELGAPDSRQRIPLQGGRLKLSGDGTLSLSFGREPEPKKIKTDPSHDAT